VELFFAAAPDALAGAGAGAGTGKSGIVPIDEVVCLEEATAGDSTS